MPLYETVMQEKPPVVLDIGTAYTKLGFAAEAFPRKIIPSEVVLTSNDQTKRLLEYNDETELYDQMVDFLQMIFFKHLLVSPKERKITIVEDVVGQTAIRETLARVLFRHFEVSSVLFVPTHFMALSTLAVGTGVVIDMGYSETTVMPIYCGVQMLNSYRDESYGGRVVHEEIKRQLMAHNPDLTAEYLTETVLEDIKVRLCFVTTLERARQYLAGEPPAAPPSVDYPIRDEVIIKVPGETRETAFEVMFTQDNERSSLPHMVLQAILNCPKDVRKPLTESILVVGGSAIIMGLMKRLQTELQTLLKEDEEYKQKFHGDIRFLFHKTIGRPNFTAWLGGTLCGGTDLIQSVALSREAYLKYNRVPDWVCLADNRLAVQSNVGRNI